MSERGLHAGSRGSVTLGNPLVPQRIEHRGIGQVRQINQHLQQPSAVTAKQLEPFVNLPKHLSNLAMHVLSHVIRNLDKVRHAAMHDGIRPTACHSESLNLTHDASFLFGILKKNRGHKLPACGDYAASWQLAATLIGSVSLSDSVVVRHSFYSCDEFVRHSRRPASFPLEDIAASF